MKFLVGMLCCVVLFSFDDAYAGDDIKLGTVNGVYYNEMLKRVLPMQVRITYDVEHKTFLVDWKISAWPVAYMCQGDYAGEVTKVIDKYVKWNKKATKKKVKISKTISTQDVRGIFFAGKDWNGGDTTLTYLFLSMEPTKHYLGFRMDEIVSEASNFIKSDPSIFYLPYKGALEFKRMVSSVNIKKEVNALKKQNKLNDEFN